MDRGASISERVAGDAEVLVLLVPLGSRMARIPGAAETHLGSARHDACFRRRTRFGASAGSGCVWGVHALAGPVSARLLPGAVRRAVPVSDPLDHVDSCGLGGSGCGGTAQKEVRLRGSIMLLL